MKYIIGLGNPEPDYTHTRHNVGKDFLNQFAKSEVPDKDWKYNKYINCDEISTEHFIIFKPYSYMNEIGKDIKSVLTFYKIDLNDLLIIYDELDMFVGEYKIAFAKYSKIHNGIRSAYDYVKSDQTWFLRIGVRDETIPGSVQKTGRNPGDYVLSKFSMTDSEKISKTNEELIIPELKGWLSKK